MYTFASCWVRADYFNPFTQLIIKLTNPVITRLRRIIPNYRNLETSTLVFILFLEIIKFCLLSLFVVNMPNVVTLLYLTMAGALKLVISTFFYAILFHAILSWIQPGYSPIAKLLSQLSSPILRPLQRAIPPVAGFDLTPLFALIILQLAMILL